MQSRAVEIQLKRNGRTPILTPMNDQRTAMRFHN
jgi:hypothetical protein